MKKQLCLIFCISIALFSGCAWFKGKDTAQPKQIKLKIPSQVINRSALQQGGSIAVIPFTAGPNVEATDELEDVALRIVKGLSLRIEKAGTALSVTDPDNSTSSFIIRGHITKLNAPGKFKKYVLRRKVREISVSVLMVDRKTGQIILNFSDHLTTTDSKVDFKSMGEKIGKNIGQFILKEYSRK